MDFGALVSLIGLAVAGIVWLVRLEGRINGQQIQMSASEKRMDSLETRIFEKLDRIENKLDAKADK